MKGQALAVLVHHSDRGTRYASRDYAGLLKERGIRISMSRKGNPYEVAAWSGPHSQGSDIIPGETPRLRRGGGTVLLVPDANRPTLFRPLLQNLCLYAHALIDSLAHLIL